MAPPRDTTLMPSIRGKAANSTDATARASLLPWLLTLFLALFLFAYWLWPDAEPTPLPTTVLDAGVRDGASSDAAPRPSARSSSVQGPRPATSLRRTKSDDPTPLASAPPPPKRRRRTVSWRESLRKKRTSPPPAPGEILCRLPPNHVVGLARIMAVTTQLAVFETYENPHRACQRHLAISLERTESGVVVNGFSFNGRDACFDFSRTVLEIEHTDDRAYALWLIPQGGPIFSCPESRPLSSYSRKERTPRQPSLSTAPPSAPDILRGAPSPSDPWSPNN